MSEGNRKCCFLPHCPAHRQLGVSQKNRQRPPNELLFFSWSEFRNVRKTGLTGNVSSEGPGCCQATSDQGELILPSKKTPLFSWFARFGLFRIFRTFDVNASGSVVYDNELQVGVETGS